MWCSEEDERWNQELRSSLDKTRSLSVMCMRTEKTRRCRYLFKCVPNARLNKSGLTLIDWTDLLRLFDSLLKQYMHMSPKDKLVELLYPEIHVHEKVQPATAEEI